MQVRDFCFVVFDSLFYSLLQVLKLLVEKDFGTPSASHAIEPYTIPARISQTIIASDSIVRDAQKIS